MLIEQRLDPVLRRLAFPWPIVACMSIALSINASKISHSLKDALARCTTVRITPCSAGVTAAQSNIQSIPKLGGAAAELLVMAK